MDKLVMGRHIALKVASHSIRAVRVLGVARHTTLGMKKLRERLVMRVRRWKLRCVKLNIWQDKSPPVKSQKSEACRKKKLT